jgi:hypothetical protein
MTVSEDGDDLVVKLYLQHNCKRKIFRLDGWKLNGRKVRYSYALDLLLGWSASIYKVATRV